MRSNFTLLFVACVIAASAQEPEREIKSKIKHVTVFLEGAQISRQSQLSIRQGVTILKFTDVSAGILEQSIQVASLPSTVKILSVSFRVNYLNEIKKPEKIAALESERRRLMAMVAQERSVEEVYKEEEIILKTNKSIGGTAKGVDVGELKVAMDYFRQRLMDIKQQLLHSDRTIRKHNEELGKIEAQLKELSDSKEKPTGEIYIKVSSKNDIQTLFTIKYLVKEARWFPSYDIRAKDIASPVGITYKANVSQHSGEDWENVNLTISSGNPSQVGARPVIKPWYVGFNNAVTYAHPSTIGKIPEVAIYGSSNNVIRGRVMSTQDGVGLPGVNVVIKGTTVGCVTDAEGYYSLTLTGDAKTLVFSFVGMITQEIPIANRNIIDVSMNNDVTQLNEVVVTGYGGSRESRSLSYSTSSYSPRTKKVITATPVVRQTDVEFNLDDPFSIKSDGELRTTDMVEYELDALFEYYCVPKLDKDAFLIAKILNWDEYNFLEGEASLFFEGKYIGKSIMDTRNTSDTLTLSLGRDANVLVTREKVKDFSSRQFIGSNQKVAFAYDIVIRNKKAQPITIWIEDQIPVANTKEISVDKVDDSKAEYSEDTGLLKWKRNIPPGKVDNLSLKYVVRYPKNSQVILE